MLGIIVASPRQVLTVEQWKNLKVLKRLFNPKATQAFVADGNAAQQDIKTVTDLLTTDFKEPK